MECVICNKEIEAHPVHDPGCYGHNPAPIFYIKKMEDAAQIVMNQW